MLDLNTIEALEKEKCTGCGACYNICPTEAIKMETNSEGFLYPVIDKEKCISCGLCKEKCPAISPNFNNALIPDCYAALADDETRMASSSGGAFSVIANYFLENKGYVCGAAWTENNTVEHILINSKEELELLRGSKYVQSDTKKVFLQIQKLLKDNHIVMFVGCPCQVAGINAFLGKEYLNLLTIDLVCHGVPSPKALDSFLKQRTSGNNIKSISFRKKQVYKWEHGTVIEFDNKTSYKNPKALCPWFKAFLNILSCRKSCGQCQFAKVPRQGDITIADFWGIGKFYPDLNDQKGTSLITVNNGKGNVYFNTIKNNFIRLQKTTFEQAKAGNWNLIGSSKEHQRRERFFKLLDIYDFDKAVEYGLERKFDIGFIGWWYGMNYGSVMTNFALHQTLTDMGKTVLMLEWPLKEKPTEPIPDTFSRRFANKYYEKTMRYTYEELPNLNRHCETFLVGSDQLWNYYCYKDNGQYFFLDFVDDSRRKISYGTSFGHPTVFAPFWEIPITAFHMHRFDAISVREDDAVDLCNKYFDIEATQVVDPVFLCDKKHYYKAIARSNFKTNTSYILAYILTPTKEKRDALINVSQKLNLPLKIILDRQSNQEQNKSIIDLDSLIVDNLEMEDWLNLFANANFIITDSFHGTCFSIIFEKKFICIANLARGISRFETLLNKINLTNRMVFTLENITQNELLYDEINYQGVYSLLKKEVDRSYQWLISALNTPKVHCISNYDMAHKEIKEFKKYYSAKINELQIKISELEQKLLEK